MARWVVVQKCRLWSIYAAVHPHEKTTNGLISTGERRGERRARREVVYL